MIWVMWFAFSVLAGAIASSRGRSFFGYFLLSIVLSPLIGIIAAWAMPSLKVPPAAGNAPSAANADDAERVRCPECQELIVKGARKCRHCGSAIEAPPPPITDGMTEAQLVDHYGILLAGGRYEVGGYRYDQAADAIAAAKRAAEKAAQ